MTGTTLLLLASLAAGDPARAEARSDIGPLRYSTSWVGNSFGGGPRWVQNAAESMQVLPDSTAAWSPDGAWISFRHTDEAYWRDAKRAKAVYAKRPAEKRPVWVVRADGTGACVVECLRYQCAMDGSRAAWRPQSR